jgi:hypothetical protein
MLHQFEFQREREGSDAEIGGVGFQDRRDADVGLDGAPGGFDGFAVDGGGDGGSPLAAKCRISGRKFEISILGRRSE